MAEALRHSRDYGFDTPYNTPFAFAAFKKKRDAHIGGLNRAYERNWDSEGIELLKGTARFVGQKVLEVVREDGAIAHYTAKHICIASGGYPIIPTDIPGAEYGITNEGVFEIEVLPSKIAIVGAGYIAVEIAGMLNAVGVEVHMFIRGEKFLRTFDPMVQEVMTKRYEDMGVIIHKGYKGFEKIEQISNGKGNERVLKLTSKDGEELPVNELLWAVGRAPETQSLDLAVASVKTGNKGYIVVDQYQNTSAEGIYALGDVTGQLELTPVAIAAGRHLSNRLFGPQNYPTPISPTKTFQQSFSPTPKSAPLVLPNQPPSQSMAPPISRPTIPSSLLCSTRCLLQKRSRRIRRRSRSCARGRRRGSWGCIC
ncbi:hypothetical protein WAI453_011058 [Rhynchosporium graminicola]